MVSGATLAVVATVSMVFNPQPEALFRKYSVADGLPSSEVHDVAQDRDGYLWFATDRGVARHDGTTFEVFSTADGLPDNSVVNLRLDATGRLWFFTWSNRTGWHDGNRFHLLEALQDHVERSETAIVQSALTDRAGNVHLGLQELGHLILAPDGSGTWAPRVGDGTGTVVARIDDDILVYQQASMEDDRGKLWWHSSDGAHALDGGFLRWDPVLLQLSDGRIVISDSERLLVTDRSGELLTVATPQGVDRVVGLAELPSGDLAIADYHHGLRILDARRQFRPKSRRRIGSTVTNLLCDREGGLWLTTFDGIRHCPGTDAVTYSFSEAGGGPSVAAVAERPNGRVLAVTERGGVYEVDSRDSQATMLFHLSGSNVGVSTMRVDAAGDPWLAGRPESVHLTGDPIRAQAYSFAYDSLPDDNGSALFATTWGVRRADGEWLGPERERYFGLHRGPSGRLWAGSADGLKVWDGSRFQAVGAPSSPLRLRVGPIAETRDGRVFAGTLGAGVVVHDGENPPLSIGPTEGLASRMVHSLHLEGDERLWVGTNRGVSWIDLQELDNGRAVARTITRSEGLASNEVNDLLVQDGTLWVATSAGLTAMSTTQRELRDPDVPTHVTRVLVDGQRVPLTTPIVLEPDQHSVLVEFVGLAISRDHVAHYSYRILGDGGSESWHRTEHSIIQLTDLKPGIHELQVVATTTGGRTSQEPATLTLRKRHALWQHRWLQAATAMTLLGLAAAGVRARSAAMRRRELEESIIQRELSELRLKALRAQINPHFMFNTMTSIQHYLTENDPLTAANYLAKFARLVRRVLEHSDRQFVTVGEELEVLELYLELESSRSRGSFTYSLTVDPELDREAEQVPSMIIQPHVENAIWHGLMPSPARGGRLDIRLERAADGMRCTIRDDGVGLNSSRTDAKDVYGGPRGTKLTEDRLRLLCTATGTRPRISIRSGGDGAVGTNGGTVVEIILPTLRKESGTES